VKGVRFVDGVVGTKGRGKKKTSQPSRVVDGERGGIGIGISGWRRYANNIIIAYHRHIRCFYLLPSRYRREWAMMSTPPRGGGNHQR